MGKNKIKKRGSPKELNFERALLADTLDKSKIKKSKYPLWSKFYHDETDRRINYIVDISENCRFYLTIDKTEDSLEIMKSGIQPRIYVLPRTGNVIVVK